MDEGRALQDVLKTSCFGCGTLNAQGLQIKSRWESDELVCRWRPPEHHIGHKGIVYGGSMASVVDCHCVWTAMATYCRDGALGIEAAPPFVTGSLTVKYLKPARVTMPLELRARVTHAADRRFTVHCRVLQDGIACALADVVAVRVDPGALA